MNYSSRKESASVIKTFRNRSKNRRVKILKFTFRDRIEHHLADLVSFISKLRNTVINVGNTNPLWTASLSFISIYILTEMKVCQINSRLKPKFTVNWTNTYQVRSCCPQVYGKFPESLEDYFNYKLKQAAIDSSSVIPCL